MHWFLKILKKPHFGTIWDHFWPKNLKTRFFPNRVYCVSLKSLCYSNVMQEMRTILSINFSLKLENLVLGPFSTKNLKKNIFPKKIIFINLKILCCRNLLQKNPRKFLPESREIPEKRIKGISQDLHFLGSKNLIGSNLDFKQCKIKNILLDNTRFVLHLNTASRVTLKI